MGYRPVIEFDPALRGGRVVAFYAYETMLLDENRLRDWLDLFDEDARYVMPMRETRLGPPDDNPNPAFYLFNDDKASLELRVARLETGLALVESPTSATQRLVTDELVVDRGSEHVDEPFELPRRPGARRAERDDVRRTPNRPARIRGRQLPERTARHSAGALRVDAHDRDLLLRFAGAMASSHAFALMEPREWDEYRQRNRQSFARRYGAEPPELAQVADESDASMQERYQRIADGHATLRAAIARLMPETIVLIADDQNENLSDANLPQVAVYTGGDFHTGRPGGATRTRRAQPELATSILEACVEGDVDMASLGAFKDDLLFAHAFGPLLDTIDPDASVRVVPIFLNAIHVPAPSPARCYRVGQVVRRALDAFPASGPVVVCASGGLSHFTAGYPWPRYSGPYGYGAIAEDFDRQILDHIAAGDGGWFATLSSKDLLDTGDVELRAWNR